jgi:hypothetical protein
VLYKMPAAIQNTRCYTKHPAETDVPLKNQCYT